MFYLVVIIIPVFLHVLMGASYNYCVKQEKKTGSEREIYKSKAESTVALTFLFWLILTVYFGYLMGFEYGLIYLAFGWAVSGLRLFSDEICSACLQLKPLISGVLVILLIINILIYHGIVEVGFLNTKSWFIDFH